MKNKLVSLIHGTDEGAYWSFSIMVRRNGTIEERNRFTYRSKGSKHITLISGTEDGFSWRFRMLLREDSSILELNKFDYSNNILNHINNREARLASNKEWKKRNRAHLRKYEKEFYCSNEGNNSKRITHAKQRDFEFVPINEYFKGAEGHHLNKDLVVYIPKKLHRSIYHSVQSGKNMQTMNIEAIQFIIDTKRNV